METAIEKTYIENKPFSELVELTWQNFMENVPKIEELIKADALVEDVLLLVAESLKPAFEDVTFRVAKAKDSEKMCLYLSPNGITPFAIEQVYFKKQAPKEFLEKWEIYIGLPADENDNELEANLNPKDLKYKIVYNDDNAIRVKVYCEAIGGYDYGMLWSAVANNIRKYLGEVHYIEYMQGFELLTELVDDEAYFSYDELKEFLILDAGGEQAWNKHNSLEDVIFLMHEYKRNTHDKIATDDIILRETANDILTMMPAFEAMYLQKESFLMEAFRKKGIVPGFIVIEKEEYNSVIEIINSMVKIANKPFTKTFMQLGLAKGERLYLDFIVWDIDKFLKVVREKLGELKSVKTAYFQPFNYLLKPICLKK